MTFHLKDIKVMDKLKHPWQSDGKKRTVECIVHTFFVSDAEDPDLYAAQPMWEWQQTEAGKWIMEHSVPAPSWVQRVDPIAWGYRYTIHANLTPEQYTYWKLKFE